MANMLQLEATETSSVKTDGSSPSQMLIEKMIQPKIEPIDYDYPDPCLSQHLSLDIQPKIEPDDQLTTIIHHKIECIDDQYPDTACATTQEALETDDENIPMDEFSDEPYELTQDTEDGPTRHKCPLCCKTFRRAHYVRRHIENVHDPEAKIFNCDQCNKSFSTKQAIERHQYVHTGVKLHTCEKCGREFSVKANLIRHQRNICYRLEKVRELPYKCECGRAYSSEAFLERHKSACSYSVENVIPDKTGDFQCGVCSQRMTTRYNIKRHYALLHPDESCPYGPLLSRHGQPYVARARLATLNDFSCGVCERKFANKARLEQHVLDEHGVLPGENDDEDEYKADEFQCGICEKTASTGYNIRRHYAFVHPSVECPYGVLVTRDGEPFVPRTKGARRDFKCGVCNQTFAMISRLDEHILREHGNLAETNKKRYKFKYVQRKLIASLNDFSCLVCNRQFVGKVRLEEHIMEEHGDMETDENEEVDILSSVTEQITQGDKVPEEGINGNAGKVPERPLQCTACGGEFKNQVKLKLHEEICPRRLRTIERTKIRTCPHCQKKFTSQTSELTLNRHLQNFICRTCSICLMKFHTRSKLHEHRRAEHKFLTSSACVEDVSLKATEGSSKYKCDLCSSAMKSLFSLKNHYAMRHPTELGHSVSLAACGLCDQTFKVAHSLNEHMMTKHSEFVSKSDSKSERGQHPGTDSKTTRHVASRSGGKMSLPSFHCQVCGSAFNQRNELTLHLKTCRMENSTEREYCTHCGKGGSSIKKHLQMFTCRTCKICKKRFSTCPELYEHRRTEHKFEPKFSVDDILSKIKEKESPYPCDQCARVCRNGRALAAHKTIHYKVRAKCSTCNKQFESPRALTAHKNLGSCLKVKSSRCSRTFDSPQAALAHYRVHKDDEVGSIHEGVVVPEAAFHKRRRRLGAKTRQKTKQHRQTKCVVDRRRPQEAGEPVSQLCDKESDPSSCLTPPCETETSVTSTAGTWVSSEDAVTGTGSVIEADDDSNDSAHVICDTCHLICLTKDDLQHHKQTFHSALITCTLCPLLTFPTRLALSAHLETHMSRPRLPIAQDHSYSSKKKKSEFETKSASHLPYKCFICMERFATKQVFSIHYNKAHDPAQPDSEGGRNVSVSCCTCFRTFISYQALNAHKRVHVEERKRALKRKDVGDDHTKPVNVDKKRKQSSAFPIVLRVTENKEHPDAADSVAPEFVNDIKIEPEDPVVCDLCQLIFMNEHELEAHKMNIHPLNL